MCITFTFTFVSKTNLYISIMLKRRCMAGIIFKMQSREAAVVERIDTTLVNEFINLKHILL